MVQRLADSPRSRLRGMPAAHDKRSPRVAAVHALRTERTERTERAERTDASAEDEDGEAELAMLRSVKERFDGLEDIDASAHRALLVARQVRERTRARGLQALGEYRSLLEAAPEERRILRDALLIGSTCFFRDEEVFAALSAGALDGLGRGHGHPLKVWVPGCSTGEEVYSLAMILREQLDGRDDGRALRIFATDLRGSAVVRGRRGEYALRGCERIATHRLEAFFQRTSKGYRARYCLRDPTVWARHDLTCDPPLSAMDLVSCRNVLQYFDVPAQARILMRLHHALRPGGLLLLGAAESTRAAPALFQPVAPCIRLYARSRAAARRGPRASWGMP
ncbi:MAG: CheR family methyltransferase [Polyangiales bacterium]